MERDDVLLDQIASEAADWFTRLREPGVPAATRAEFTRWLLRSPDHINEYMAVVRVWGDLGAVRDEDLSPGAVTRAALAAPLPTNIISLDREPIIATGSSVAAAAGHASSSVTHRAVLRKAQRRWLIAAAAAMVAGVGITWLALQQWSDPTRMQTRVGEQRTLALRDGSVIDLNTNSEVRIEYTESERRVRLIRGEAMFSVAKNPARPFIVETQTARVRAIGTAFNVRQRDEQTFVAVFEGRVAVGSATSEHLAVPDSPQRALNAGERAVVLPRGDILPNAGPPLERLRAWPDKRLVFRSETLASLVEEVNRYHEHPIRIADPGVASVLVSGSFAADDLESLIQYLEQYRDIRAERTSEGGYVLSRASP